MNNREDDFSRQQQHVWEMLTSMKQLLPETLYSNIEESIQGLLLRQTELEKENAALRLVQIDLEKTKAHYADLYDSAPVGYLTLNAEGIIQEINRTAANLINRDCAGIVNQPFAGFVSGGYQAVWNRHFQLALQSCDRQGCELPFEHENSRIVYLHLNCCCIDNGDNPRLMRITLTDVTGRKALEAELRIAAAAFEAQESILVTDTRRIIQKVNKAFTRITGYSAQEAVGKTPALLRSGLHEKDYYKQILETVSCAGYWQGEIWNKRKNGELFPVLQTITAVTDEHGNLTHYVGAMIDISIRKKAEKMLLDAKKNLENQVITSQEELDQIKAETVEINAALNVLLRQRETERTGAQIALTDEVEATVLPLLKKIKIAYNDRFQILRLIKLLEDNLGQLVKSYGRAGNLASVYQKLTPIETQVAAMIRQGQPTKVIAAALNIAPGTVSIHRKHIRKKLGLDGKKDNLYSYLLALTE